VRQHDCRTDRHDRGTLNTIPAEVTLNWRSRAVRVAAASLGNAMECYDFIIYGTFAVIIAEKFFPNKSANTSLLITFGTFGVSFIFRPLGGIVIGGYADRAGRKAALLLTMLLMFVGTLAIAIIPGYAAIGIIAPIVVVAGRLAQGFSAGGEFASATAFLAEQSTRRRAFYASWQFASQGLSMVLAAGVGYLITSLLNAAQVSQWGWRAAFLFGLLIGPVLIYSRAGLQETEEFQAVRTHKNPVRDVLASQKRKIAMAAGSVVLATASIYVALYMPAYAVRQLELTQRDGFAATALVGLTMLLLTPLFGCWVDRVGRLRIAWPSALLLCFAPIPLYAWLRQAPSLQRLCITQLALAVPMSAYLAALSAFLADLFPVSNRSTGISLGYNLSVMIFGGFAPFIITWLIAATASPAIPAYYLAAAAATSLIAIAFAWRSGYR
jgi:MHS family proline/betaine transporter-like MFS transporter